MSTRALLLLCLATGTHGVKKAGFQKVPEFYTTSDCSGPIDAESKTWSTPADDEVAVMPFKTEGAYMRMWAYNTCLTGAGLAYSVKLTANETACAAGGDKAEQFVLNYYTDKLCTTPVSTAMRLGTCVPYVRGSVRLVPDLSEDDLCIATNYVSKTAGGWTRSREWVGDAHCKGEPTYDSLVKERKECGAAPDCAGCCPVYDESCKVVKNTYAQLLSACKKVNNVWQYNVKLLLSSDPSCSSSKQLPDVFMGATIAPGQCYPENATIAGPEVTIMITFPPPTSEAVQCEYMDMALRNNIDPSIVSWDELNAGVVVVPHTLALLAFVAAVLVW